MKQSKNLTTSVMGTGVKDALISQYELKAQPKLIADWNFNRYATPKADNSPQENAPSATVAFDVDCFPITSIVEPNRPQSKGIAKALVGQSLVASNYSTPMEPKFYISDQEDIYKYWVSPTITDGSGNFPEDYAPLVPGEYGTTVAPYVDYDTPVMINKIVVRFENTWATPNLYRIYVDPNLTPDRNWTQVGGDSPALNNATGVMTLYYNGTAWVTTRPATLVSTPIQAIQVRVFSMKTGYNRAGQPTKITLKQDRGGWFMPRRPTSPSQSFTDGKNSALQLIAIEGHLEADLTSRLISVNDEFDSAEESQLYPIGTITSNQGGVVLDNSDQVFDYENVSSPYYGLLEKNVEFNLEYIYTISGVQHSVQQFRMYSEQWQTSDDGTVSVDLQDYSKFLKVLKPNPMMYENVPVSQAVWRVLDSVGFPLYDIRIDDSNSSSGHTSFDQPPGDPDDHGTPLPPTPAPVLGARDNIIPVFWTTGEETVWEVLDSLAQGSQTAIWINGNGYLQVRTRNAAFNKIKDPDWHLRGQKVSTNLPDIISLHQTQDFEANKLTITYKTAKWRTGDYGEPAMSKVWEPETDTLVARSTPLQYSLGTTDPHFILPASEVPYWPYKSKVQIDGEILEYDGKFFVYFTGDEGEVTNYEWVRNHDQYTALNESTPIQHRYRNAFTGHVWITNRGIWGTVNQPHVVGDYSAYRTKMIINDQNSPNTYNDVTGFVGYPESSSVGIWSHPWCNGPNDLYFVTRDYATSTGFEMQGARMAFAGGYQHERAGIGLRQSGNEEDGYFIECRPTNLITNRSAQNEVMLWSRKGRVWTLLHLGVPIAIPEWTWFDLDVSIKRVSGQDVISVYYNGIMVCKATTTNGTRQPNSGKMSMFTRGKTMVGIEYFYGVAEGALTPASGQGFYDLKLGGFRSGAWELEQVWQIGYRWRREPKDYYRVGKYPYKKNIYFFDEFGPYVHEVRTFDVKFDPAPVQYSTLFSTNEWFSVPVEYYSNPFKAHFTIANVGRTHAILHGEDNLTYAGAGATINQVCVVLGRDLVLSDDKTVEVKNDVAIRRRGLIETEMSNQWIQNEAMAKDLGNWMLDHWGGGVDELEVEMFGNPLLEVGDIVDIDYDELHMDPTTHSYFVTGIKTDFEAGVGTTLTLRRVRPATTPPDNPDDPNPDLPPTTPTPPILH